MYKKHIKRILDIVLSGIALVILSPLFLATVLLVKIKLGSPVIYRQERPGLNEELFKLYKFRSMTDARDSDGNLLPDEERLSHFGRVLRTTSLDELPELINIFKGDMSIVGPRPLLVRYLPYYKNSERVRHSVRPGLTGLAQVNGRNNLAWDERLGLDVKYVNEMSFLNDCKIIIKTVKKVVKRSDIASGDQLIMKDLDVERSWMLSKEEVHD